jgi:hypothetical protein
MDSVSSRQAWWFRWSSRILADAVLHLDGSIASHEKPNVWLLSISPAGPMSVHDHHRVTLRKARNISLVTLLPYR